MSKFYRSQRVRNLFAPNCTKPFKLSRSKIELFLECPRCFYNDRRLGVGRPPSYPFTLNSAVDKLLKIEFDHYRKIKQPHPYMIEAGISAIPFSHCSLEIWRDALHGGVKFEHKATNLVITGAIDDLWINEAGQLIVVDYKATSKRGIVSMDSEWQMSYKRQLSIYAWLLKQNGFPVYSEGYFVYCNGISDREFFGNQLSFSVSILACQINDGWIEDAIIRAYECLKNERPPNPTADCEYCSYYSALSRNATNLLPSSIG